MGKVPRGGSCGGLGWAMRLEWGVEWAVGSLLSLPAAGQQGQMCLVAEWGRGRAKGLGRQGRGRLR